MKMFDLKGSVLGLISPNIVSLLTSIELYKGKTLNVEKLKKVDKLKAIAKHSSTIASNFLGNVFLSEQKEKEFLDEVLVPESLAEHMVVGYSKALDLIDKVYSYQPFDRNFICTLHYYLYKDYNPEFGGKFKDTQNYVQELMPDGSFRTIYVPVAPEEAIILLDNLIYQFNECMKDEQCNKLLTIVTFVLDFMGIHPFNHGNGRVSRLILNFLLKKYGYKVDDYFAISYLIRVKINDYIDAFESSIKGWYEGDNDYLPYVTFVLKAILEAYHKVDYIMETNDNEYGTAEDRIFKIVVDSATPIGKTVIQNILYAASSVTIEKALAKLIKDGKIQLVSKGRYSKYFRA